MKTPKSNIARWAIAVSGVALSSFAISNLISGDVDPEFPHFEPDKHVVTALPAVELSTARSNANMLSNNEVFYYRAWSNMASGAGDILRFIIDENNNPQTEVNLNVPDLNNAQYVPHGGDGDTWSANQIMIKKLEDDPTWWDNRTGSNKRRVFTRIQAINGSDYGQIPFTHNALSPVKALVDDGGGNLVFGDMFPDNLVRHIRGDRLTERRQGGSFPNRHSLIGSVIHSNLVFVNSNQSFGYGLTSFATSGHARPDNLLVVPSQDGMVHVFDAITGEEKYAYVPSMVLHGMSQSKAGGVFYGVDGKVTVADALGPDGWGTFAAGGMGRGGKGFYILELTDTADENGSNILYERRGTNTLLLDIDENVFSDSDSEDADIGMIFEKPAIYRFSDNNIYAVFGNGYNSESRNAVP